MPAAAEGWIRRAAPPPAWIWARPSHPRGGPWIGDDGVDPGPPRRPRPVADDGRRTRGGGGPDSASCVAGGVDLGPLPRIRVGNRGLTTAWLPAVQCAEARGGAGTLRRVPGGERRRRRKRERVGGMRLAPTIHAKGPPHPIFGAQYSRYPLQRCPLSVPPASGELAPPRMGGGRTDSPHPLARR